MKTKKAVIIELKCPNCSGKVNWDLKATSRFCPYCNNPLFTKAETEDKEVLCPNCGGILNFNPETQTEVCSSCKSNFRIIDEDDIIELNETADYIFPFTVSQQEYEKAVVQWLAEGEAIPIDIFKKFSLVNNIGIYLPFYRYKIEYDADYSCSVGYDREETYTEWVNEYKDGRTRKVPVTRRRTVTDWCPYSDTKSGKIVYDFSASDFLVTIKNQINKAEAELDFQTFSEDETGEGSPKTYSEHYMSGFASLGFSKSKKDAYNHSIIDTIIDRKIKNSIPGDHYKDLSYSQSNEPQIIWSVYKPFWITKYSYEDIICLNVGDGNKAENMIGTRPVDHKLRQKYRSCLYPAYVGFFISVILTILLFSGESDVSIACGWAWILSIVSLLIGFLTKKAMKLSDKTQRSEQANILFQDGQKLFDKKSAILIPNEKSNVIS